MTDRIIRAVATSGIFAAVSSVVVSLLMTALLYFELAEIVVISKILYGAFVVILLMTSFVAARIIGSRGLLTGLSISGIVILFSVMYRLIGLESGLEFGFLGRSVVTVLAACGGTVVGVNTSKS